MFILLACGGEQGVIIGRISVCQIDRCAHTDLFAADGTSGMQLTLDSVCVPDFEVAGQAQDFNVVLITELFCAECLFFDAVCIQIAPIIGPVTAGKVTVFICFV